MTLQNATQQLISRLSAIYEESEANNIADLVMEKLTGQNRMNRKLQQEELLSAKQRQQLKRYTEELVDHRPVQYVLEEAWFAGMKFRVNEHVLIPRPETEELVEWVVNDHQLWTPDHRGFLDIGTGSGCISITLKKKFPEADILACDVSGKALEVAISNARTNEADVQFIQCDILNKEHWDLLPEIDVIVSNPPYIPLKDRATMRENVLNYEPVLALFVPNEDPLLFYKAIAELAIAKKTATVYFEIHEEQGDVVVELLKAKGFKQVELKKDMQGKDRMVKADFRAI